MTKLLLNRIKKYYPDDRNTSHRCRSNENWYFNDKELNMTSLKKLNLCFLVIGFMLSANVAAQKIVYISDVLFVPLRSGQSVEYRIINAAMKSGTKLTQLEISEDGEWSKVVTEAGTEGWIRNQYLSDEMTAQLKLNQAVSRLARLEKENAELLAKNSDLTKQNIELSSFGKKQTQSKNSVAEELERVKKISANAIELDRRYQALLEKHELTQTERDSLSAENENMKKDRSLSFMLYGAAILALGMFLAVILPLLKPKRRYSDWA